MCSWPCSGYSPSTSGPSTERPQLSSGIHNSLYLTATFLYFVQLPLLSPYTALCLLLVYLKSVLVFIVSVCISPALFVVYSLVIFIPNHHAFYTRYVCVVALPRLPNIFIPVFFVMLPTPDLCLHSKSVCFERPLHSMESTHPFFSQSHRSPNVFPSIVCA